MKIGNKLKDGFVKPPEDETSFADLPDAYGEPASLELQEKN